MAQIPKHRQLPDKESKLFKELLTQYELKQWKKGIKAADTILKKFPNHGETLALKALTLHSSLPMQPTVGSVGKQEEVETMARTAIKKDMTSHITWHVLGILAKSRKDWAEASRAFVMARKQDSENLPLLRDSISLYLHTRQYPQAVSARHQYLMIRPQFRAHWLGLMVAYHLNGDYEEALHVYDGYMSCMNIDGGTGPEKSQVGMYVVKMCMEAGRWDEALERLSKALSDKIISPRGESSQIKAEILVALGRMDEAEDTYRTLLEQNSDNLEYYRGFLRTKGLDFDKADDTTREKILNQLSTFTTTYPKSAAPRRLALDISTGETFRTAVRTYLIDGLERGIPSLFVDVKGVYRDLEKMKVVGEVVEDIIEKTKNEVSLHGDESIAPPTTLLWAYYYLALHLSHPLHPSPNHKRSLDLLEIALKHTPTLPEVYMAKARVLKRAGDPMGAAIAMEEARSLDGQDRWINGKAAKYWLRAGDVAKAEELVGMFTKKDVTPVADLTDLQCLWFLTEEGDAHYRKGNLALALKRYQALATTFQEYEDDQYDFHTYCMRRMTFSAYVELMRYEDQLRSHPGYFKGALSAIEIYTRISDDPSLTEEKLTAEEEAERKRAAKKAQKAEQKAKKAAAATGDGKKEDAPLPDPDPEGKTLLKTEQPLEEAYKLWKPLEKLASRRAETWIAGYEIQIRRKLYLAALHCLLEAHTIDSEAAGLHSLILNFRRTIVAAKDLPPSITSVIEATFPTLLPTGTTSEEYNSAFLSKHQYSPQHILGGAKGLLEIHLAKHSASDNQVSEIASALNRLTEEGVPPVLSVLQDALQLLVKAGADETTLEAFKLRCKTRLPLAEVFASKEEIAVRKAIVEEEVKANGTVKADV